MPHILLFCPEGIRAAIRYHSGTSFVDSGAVRGSVRDEEKRLASGLRFSGAAEVREIKTASAADARGGGNGLRSS